MSQHHPNTEAQPQSLDAALATPLEVGEPDVSGPLAVYPIYAPEPSLDYVSFTRAHGLGQTEITELKGGASVNDLAVQNNSGKAVLLYEGEELLGAQQNRVLDISILIAAETKTRIPVSCVEAGRWDGSRHRERFRPSRQAADPELRKRKHRRARERVALGAAARADQGEVWSEVSDRAAELATHSPTAAMHDIYESRRDRLGELREPIRLHDNQCGAVCAIAGEISILDLVGRTGVWADLHPALLEGYALDALRLGGPGSGADRAPEPPELTTVRGFTLLVTDAPADRRRHEAGVGETVRFASGGVAGSALVAPKAGDGPGEGADELVQLTAYPEQPGGEPDGSRSRRPRPRTRVRRPSARRPRE